MANCFATVGLLAVLGFSQAFADTLNFASGTTRVNLMELYTSEGCSSCPPADRWLSGFRQDPRLWRQVVPVAFHVDYWDGIGWPDRFAFLIYSNRQRAYAWQGLTRTVYIPGFFLNGKEWRGSQRRLVAQAHRR